MLSARTCLIGSFLTGVVSVWAWLSTDDVRASLGLTTLTVVLALIGGSTAFASEGAPTVLEALGVEPEPAVVAARAEELDEALPDDRSSIWPLVCAVALLMIVIGGVFDRFLVYLGGGVLAISVAAWTNHVSIRPTRSTPMDDPGASPRPTPFNPMVTIARSLTLGLGVLVTAIGLMRGSTVTVLGIGLFATGIVANAALDAALAAQRRP